MSDLKKIRDFIQHENIAMELSNDELDTIGNRVKVEYDVDDGTREQWKKKIKSAMNLAMQIWEQKNFPFENSANIKYPLLSKSAIQFSARTYPNFIKGSNLVKALVIGEDRDGKKADRAYRISQHMSYQCLHEMEEWEEDMDFLLTVLPIVGCVFKKTYFSPEMGRNCSPVISPEDVVINYWAKNLKLVPRITHIYQLYPNEIEERKRADLFLDNFELGVPTSVIDEKAEEALSGLDLDSPHVFLEQHRFLDLDKDGYKEPYIVTIHKDTSKVVRITARYDEDKIFVNRSKIIRIEPVHYFTKYTFLPSPDGSIYDLGFGLLLSPINETINSTTNQLLDAGTISNAQSGFIGKGVNLGRGRGGGNITLKLNEWRPINHSGDDLRKSIFPLPVKPPSPVLFNLLGTMISAGEQLSSVTEILTGDQSVQNEPATTTLARIEQGLKVFSAIQKRVYRSLKEELKKLRRLNKLYLSDMTYFQVLDTEEVKNLARMDYEDKDLDVMPVADPNQMSETQKIVKAQILMGLLGQGLNDMEIKKYFLEAVQMDDIKRFMMPEDYQPPPDPKLEIEAEKLRLDKMKLSFEMAKFMFESAEIQSRVIKNIAEAESKEAGIQLDQYKIEMQNIFKIASDYMKINQKGVGNGNQQGRVPGMEGGQGNEGGVPSAQGQEG